MTERTPERVAEAIRLRESGVPMREIAVRFGIGLSAAYEWTSDPDQAKWRARRAKYAVECSVCGQTIANSSKEANPDEPVCKGCAGEHYATWTREAIVFAIQEWADRNGGVPPTANDFWRDRARLDERVPSVNHVLYRWGTWNAAIEAAGFEPHAIGPVGGFDVLTPEQRKECADRYAAGESLTHIAAHFDTSVNTVRKWVANHGVPIGPRRRTYRKAA